MRDFFKRIYSSVFNGDNQDDQHSEENENKYPGSDESYEIQQAAKKMNQQISRASRNQHIRSQIKGNQHSDNDQQSQESGQRKRVEKRTTKQKQKSKTAKLYNRRTRSPIQSESDKSSCCGSDHNQKLIEETKEDFDHLKTTVEKSMGQVEGLTCAICMDFIINCRTAVCGHSFCEECIHESLIRKKECPHCRKDIRKWVQLKSEMIDKAVKMMVDSKSANGNDEEIERYNTRIQNHKNWLKKHTLCNARPGQKVDVLDTEHIWCTAEVEIKILAEDRKPLLYLHYDGWSRKYDEYLYMDSSRVAPLGVYTSRNDIPRYRMCQHQSNMMYANVVDSARQAAAPVNPDPVSSEEEGDNNDNENAEDEAALAIDEPDNQELGDEVPELEVIEEAQAGEENFEEDVNEESFMVEDHVQQIQEEIISEAIAAETGVAGDNNIRLQNSAQELQSLISASRSAFADEAISSMPSSLTQTARELAERFRPAPARQMQSLFNAQHRDSILNRSSGLARSPLNTAPALDIETQAILASRSRNTQSEASEDQAEILQVQSNPNQSTHELAQATVLQNNNNELVEEQEPQMTVAGTTNVITNDYFTASNTARNIDSVYRQPERREESSDDNENQE